MGAKQLGLRAVREPQEAQPDFEKPIQESYRTHAVDEWCDVKCKSLSRFQRLLFARLVGGCGLIKSSKQETKYSFKLCVTEINT